MFPSFLVMKLASQFPTSTRSASHSSILSYWMLRIQNFPQTLGLFFISKHKGFTPFWTDIKKNCQLPMIGLQCVSTCITLITLQCIAFLKNRKYCLDVHSRYIDHIFSETHLQATALGLYYKPIQASESSIWFILNPRTSGAHLQTLVSPTNGCVE